jgi:hypothetical protein
MFVLEQAAHQLGARVFGLLPLGRLFGRQEHARFDLDEHGSHEQIFRRKLQIGRADLLDIA